MVHTEMDVVWFDNPIEFMREHEDIDLMYATDMLVSFFFKIRSLFHTYVHLLKNSCIIFRCACKCG